MGNGPKTISQILDLIKQRFKVDKNNRFKLWFRGQQNFDDKLIPPIFRQGKDYGNKLYEESNMFHEFLILSDAQTFNTKSTFEKLVLMQHYGIPTRLLDWSENMLVGLFFALYKKDQYGYYFEISGDSALYILDPISINVQIKNEKGKPLKGMFKDGIDEVIIRANLSFVNSIKEYSELTEIKDWATKHKLSLDISENKNSFEDAILQTRLEQPIAVFPKQNNSRLINQKGTFTLHGGKLQGNDIIINFTPLEENKETQLLKIPIKSENKNSLKEELDYCGINESTLFPELPMQADYIKKVWSRMTNN